MTFGVRSHFRLGLFLFLSLSFASPFNAIGMDSTGASENEEWKTLFPRAPETMPDLFPSALPTRETRGTYQTTDTSHASSPTVSGRYIVPPKKESKTKKFARGFLQFAVGFLDGLNEVNALLDSSQVDSQDTFQDTFQDTSLTEIAQADTSGYGESYPDQNLALNSTSDGDGSELSGQFNQLNLFGGNQSWSGETTKIEHPLMGLVLYPPANASVDRQLARLQVLLPNSRIKLTTISDEAKPMSQFIRETDDYFSERNCEWVSDSRMINLSPRGEPVETYTDASRGGLLVKKWRYRLADFTHQDAQITVVYDAENRVGGHAIVLFSVLVSGNEFEIADHLASTMELVRKLKLAEPDPRAKESVQGTYKYIESYNAGIGYGGYNDQKVFYLNSNGTFEIRQQFHLVCNPHGYRSTAQASTASDESMTGLWTVMGDAYHAQIYLQYSDGDTGTYRFVRTADGSTYLNDKRWFKID